MRVPAMRHAPPQWFIADWQGEALQRGPPAALLSVSTPTKARIWHLLIVDDDPSIRDMIADYLVAQDVRVSTAANSQRMMEALTATTIDLAVLDLKLGDESGLEILRSVRAVSDLPIIVLTGQHRDEVDRILGLELGADDYLTKPFSPRELWARIRAVLRRSQQRPHGADLEREENKRIRYRFAGWELSLRSRRLTSPSGETVSLTKGEFTLLAAFVQAPQRVLSREHLLRAGHAHRSEVFDRSIDVQILRLRRKIEPNSLTPELIKTERGIGYVFTAAVEVI